MDILFKALNDATRRHILQLLQERDLTAGEVAGKFRMSWPSISHHLDLLKQAGLVVAQKEGQYIYYTLNTAPIDEISKWLASLKAKRKHG